MTQRNLIHRLKQQPRHGMGIWDDIKNSADGVAGIAELTLALKNVLPVVDAFTNSAVQMSTGLEAIVGVNERVAAKFKSLTNATLYLELRNKELNKTFGINSKSAATLSSKIQETADALKVSGEQMQKYARSIKGIAPTINHLSAQNNKYYQGLARVQQVLTTNLGLTEEQAAKYSGFAAQSGKSADEQLGYQYELAKSVETATGMQGSFKMMTEGIAELTEDVQLQYGRIPGSLQMGVLKAKALGFEMSQMSKTAENLLNIESSIGQELEYQLLSGRRLVDKVNGKSLTNLYREATLRGNMNDQANTLNKILEQEGDTLRTNLFARKQMSELLGMDEASLARALQKKSILESLPGGEALFDQTGDALMEAAKAAGATEEQMKELLESEDTRTTDQKIEQVLKMMVESGIKAQLVDQAGTVSGTSAELLKQAGNVPAAGAGYSGTTVSNIGGVLASTTLAGAGINLTGATITGETVPVMGESVIIKASTGTETDASDVVVPAGSSKAILMGPDRINLRDDDVIVAGTNLGGGGGGNDQLQSTMLQVGAMIVNAINRKQTDQLFGGGINAPYYG
jgi:hypothetical protein